MKRIKWITLLVLLIACNLVQAVPINGKDWRQLTETTGFSWNEIATVCNTGGGTCNGSLGAVDFTGWNWASVNEVSNLFSFFNPSFPGTVGFYREVNSSWAPDIYTYLDPTFDGSIFNPASNRVLQGLTSTAHNNGDAYRALTIDQPSMSHNDTMQTNSLLGTSLSGGSLGVWLYRDLPTTGVFEPSSFLLMGLGLMGLTFTRRKN